jgi:uncharacterized SAM-binding protein YcdF (DUF218 family)
MPRSQVGPQLAPLVDAPRKHLLSGKRLLLFLLLAAIFAGVLGLLARAGSFLVVHAPKRAQVLVVLEGGAGSSRFAQALNLQKAGYAPLVLVDADVTRDYYGKSEADLVLEYLQRTRQSGIEVCPTTADSTYSEVPDVQRCMQRAGATSAIIVTSDFHTRRALEIFRRRLPQYEWSVAASSWPANAAEQWWKHRWWAKTVLDEGEKYLWWELVDRWRSDVVLK